MVSSLYQCKAPDIPTMARLKLGNQIASAAPIIARLVTGKQIASAARLWWFKGSVQASTRSLFEIPM